MAGVMWVASRGGLLLQSLALLLSLLSLSASAEELNYEAEKRILERLQFYLGDPVATNEVIAKFRESGGFANNIEAADRNLNLALTYSFSQRARFLIDSYGDSSTAVVIYEDAEPFYLIGASTGSVSSGKFLTSDLTQPCPFDRGDDVPCTLVRSSVRDIEGSPMDGVLVKAFEHHHEAGYPKDVLSISTEHMKDVESSVYVSQSTVIEQEGGQLAWRVLTVALGTDSNTDSITKGDPLFPVMWLIDGLVLCVYAAIFWVMMFSGQKEKAVLLAVLRFTCAFVVGCILRIFAILRFTCSFIFGYIFRNFYKPQSKNMMGEDGPEKQLAKDREEPKPQWKFMLGADDFEHAIAKDEDEPKPPSEKTKTEEGSEKPISKDEVESNPDFEHAIAKDEDESKPPSEKTKSEEDSEKPISKDGVESKPQKEGKLEDKKAQDKSNMALETDVKAISFTRNEAKKKPAKDEEEKTAEPPASDPESPKAKSKNENSKPKEKEEGTAYGEDERSEPPTSEPNSIKAKRNFFAAAFASVKARGVRRNKAKKKPAKDEGEKSPEPPASTRDEAEPKGSAVSRSAKDGESSELGRASLKGAKWSVPYSAPQAKKEKPKKFRIPNSMKKKAKR
jgi:hypothetical protein